MPRAMIEGQCVSQATVANGLVERSVYARDGDTSGRWVGKRTRERKFHGESGPPRYHNRCNGPSAALGQVALQS